MHLQSTKVAVFEDITNSFKSIKHHYYPVWCGENTADGSLGRLKEKVHQVLKSKKQSSQGSRRIIKFYSREIRHRGTSRRQMLALRSFGNYEPNTETSKSLIDKVTASFCDIGMQLLLPI